MHPTNQSEREPRVVISNSSTRDWQGVLVELEQSLRACSLLADLLSSIESSLQVSVQSLSEARCPEYDLEAQELV